MAAKNGSIPWNKGITHSQDTKQKIRAARALQIITLEMREKARLRMLGNSLAKGNKLSAETRRRMSLARIGNKNSLGHHPSEETRKRMSEARRGNKYARGYIHSPETRRKVSIAGRGKRRSLDTRRKMSAWQRGPANHNWRGGVTKEHEAIRNSMEYAEWRKAVFERDRYRCVWAGEEIHKGPFEADHIKPFALFPALRFELSNGRTLCKPCHRKTDTYGVKTSAALRNVHTQTLTTSA